MRNSALLWIVFHTIVTVQTDSDDNKTLDKLSSPGLTDGRGKKGISQHKDVLNVLQAFSEGISKKGDSLNQPEKPVLWKKSNIGRYRRDDSLFMVGENIPGTHRTFVHAPEAELAPHHRSKRTTVQLSQEGRDLLLELQNFVRSGEGSSNMEYNVSGHSCKYNTFV